MKVSVYILSSKPNSERMCGLASLFKNDLFDVNLFNVEDPEEINDDYMEKKKYLEDYRFRAALEDAYKRYPHRCTVLVKDTSVSNCTSEEISEIVGEVAHMSGWHLCYLCRWLDECHHYSHHHLVEGKSTQVVKTKSPFGTQALMFSPQGRDIVLGHARMKNGKEFFPRDSLGQSLNKAISKNYLTAVSIVPNLIEFDVSLAKKYEDYFKVAACRPPTESNMVYNDNGGYSLLWFIIAVLFVFLLLSTLWGFSR